MSNEVPFSIISVTGAHSGVGKTTLCSILLGNLKGFGAIKFTKTPMYTTVIDDPEVIRQEGKDTAVILESGAERVVWIQSPRSGLEEALDIAMGRMTGLKGVVVEGNSPADFINPHLVIFVIGGEGEIKPSAVKMGQRADAIVVNSGDSIKTPSLPVPLSQKHAPVFRIDLKNKKGEIDKLISFVKKYIQPD
ncbi:MAG: hypothetical protein C4560_07015 [Nitrospiraceae bacterium]|nr:MAG: hypothetical protein C4560_07015 [Nitrospiraceae bacterium]